MDLGVIDCAVTFDADWTREVGDADVVFLATPGAQFPVLFATLAGNLPPHAIVTDAGSTKQKIVAELNDDLPRGCRFLGSHPLAGSEKTGAAFAAADLFEGRVAILTPTKHTRAEDFDFLEEFWQSLGSVVVQMTPEEHDKALALTSHLPHIAAAAMTGLIPEKYFRLTGMGMLDTTRIAAGDPELWLQIFIHNRDNILTALEQYGSKLSILHAALRDGDAEEILKILTLAKKNRDALGS
jgi:prephenate dehydrogenase